MRLFLTITCFIFFINVKALEKENNLHSAPTLRAILQKIHISPIVEDTTFYNNVFQTFIKLCDPNKIFLLNSDIDTFEKYKDIFKDELDGKNHFFINKISPIFKQRVMKSDSIVRLFSIKPFDLSIDDFYNTELNLFPRNEKELETRCRQYLKAVFLRKLLMTNKVDSIFTKELLLKREKEIRAKTIQETLRGFKEIIDDESKIEKNLGELLCKSITEQYDPHTQYFTNEDYQEYKNNITGEEKLFGFTIDNNSNGEIILNNILPGSPAWSSGEINDGDVLISIKNAKGNLIYFDGESRKSANELFSSVATDSIEVEILKPNGKKMKVKIQKAKLKPDDNFVRSWILETESKIGYISLPSFYSSDQNIKGANSADDVAKEIVKLKNEGVEGLIFDIRNNGGGSLDQATHMVGIFINEGVVDIIKYREGRPVSNKDPNQGILFDKPMIVLIDETSASASEVFAGALQDYNRAVIVGSNSYGKATSQVILPMDSNFEVYLTKNKLPVTSDYIKVTIGKIYRPSGRSSQLRGVEPDIELPGYLKLLGISESNSKGCLPNDTVKKAVYFSPLLVQTLQTIIESSKKRRQENKFFQKLETYIKKIEDFESKDTSNILLLKIDTYIERWKVRNSIYQSYPTMDVESKNFKIRNHFFDIDQMKVDTLRDMLNKAAIDRMYKDAYLEECMFIISDLVAPKK